jgi:hypothetical protein
MLTIFGNLDLESLFNAGAVCREWQRITNEEKLWKPHLEEFQKTLDSDKNLNDLFKKRGNVDFLDTEEDKTKCLTVLHIKKGTYYYKID